ncbi:MAG: sigma-54-dependent Fis family transcriptional regulator [Deltaproteobacteria bacterium]|nr:sigma-54-dependent Fis family transcriptional regulator [Deltaproteobacteria bacterium]
MSSKKILVVDDEKNITFVIKAILEKGGFGVDAWNDPMAALKALKNPAHGYCAVITDLYMPQMSGMQILDELRGTQPDLPVVMITAFGSVESAVEALKKGAFDYVTKPFEQGEILAIAEKAANTHGLRQREPLPLSSESELSQSLLVGKSPQMQEVHRVIGKVAGSPSTVLLSGESGTGKELVALEIHRGSDRAEKPFIKINCAAIPQSLIESELFGYEKGAFTGAVSSKPGRFELAHEGTLFLDEIAEMPVEMQVKLLRVIQESEFERVGGLSTLKIDVRLIAATNRDLAKEVRDARFREDLFYRLNVVPIYLPPLRERRADIEDLIYFFARKFNERLGKNIQTIDHACLQKLLTYSWPGNIRQLENVLERAVLMSEGGILRAQDLPPEVLEAGAEPASAEAESEINRILEEFRAGKPFKDIVKSQTQTIERQIIEQALEQNAGNITKTAVRLGLSRKGLQLKLKELGMVAPRAGKEEV